MPRTEQQLLEVVYERSAAITRRRRVTTAALVVASIVTLVAIPFGLLRDTQDATVIRPVATQPRTASTPGPGDRPRPTDDAAPRQAPVAERPARSPGRTDAPAIEGKCDVVIEDEADSKDERLDVLSSRIDRNDGFLTFTHRLRDLTDVRSTGEELTWDLSFAFGQQRYTVHARDGSDPLGNETSFTLRRGDEEIAALSGLLEPDADRISIDMGIHLIDGLGDGSVLSGFSMFTNTTKLATNDADTARGSCRYVL
jgi:hypothetical protein